jgi:hypothetical protein
MDGVVDEGGGGAAAVVDDAVVGCDVSLATLCCFCRLCHACFCACNTLCSPLPSIDPAEGDAGTPDGEAGYDDAVTTAPLGVEGAVTVTVALAMTTGVTGVVVGLEWPVKGGT